MLKLQLTLQMEEFLKDLRYGIRLLMSSRAFAFTAVITMALGIGANTALFSVINGVLLQPLTFPNPNRLVVLYEKRAQFPYASISYPNFLDWKRDNHTFESMAAFRSDDFSLTTLTETERVKGEMISANLFRTLGVRPILGQDLDPQEDHLGGKPEVLISEALWRRKFGGSRAVLGKALRLNGTDYTLVGVVPVDFRLGIINFGAGKDVYVPIGQWTDPDFQLRNAGEGTDAIGRLKPGITFEAAESDMRGVAHSLGQIYPAEDSAVGIRLVRLKDTIVGNVRPYLLVLQAAVLLVLLIACVNVANLLLARSMVRSREIAIRLALGAHKLRVVRQLLTESVLLSLCGGVLGFILAAWGTPTALQLLGDSLPRAADIHLNGPVLLFTLLVAVVSGVLFGLAPALKSLKSDLQVKLREGGRGNSAVRSRTQQVFAAIEIAMAVVLLVGAGLMIRSLAQLWNVNPGFRANNVLFFEVALPAALRHAPPDAIRAELKRLHEETAAVPGVESASLDRGAIPMYGDDDDPFWIAGKPKPAREADMPWALWYQVEPQYFKVMGIPLKRGRLFDAGDNRNTRFVTVIDEDFARQYFPNQDPIGKSIIDEFIDEPAEIIGVVGHVKHWGLDDKLNLHAQFYIPFAQLRDKDMRNVAGSIGVLVRSQEEPLAMLEPIRRKILSTNREEVVFNSHAYQQIVSDTLSDRSFAMRILGVFAALALILAAIGIYGVVSYVAGQRTHEIGVRIALGARRGDVLRMVLGEGAQTALIGIGVGVVLALGLTRLMSSVLYGVSSTDPLTFVGVVGVLTLITLAASYIPARHAMKVDPAIALRYE